MVACSRGAACAGVAVGMAVAEARTLVGQVFNLPDTQARLTGRLKSCPTFVEHEPEVDRDTLRTLSWQCQRYSPLVGLEEGERPEGLFLNTTGCDHLFGGEGGLLRQIAADFRRQRLFVRTAVACSLGLAWGAAHFADAEAVVVPEGKQEAFLASLPVEALRLPEETVEMLRGLDLRHVGELLTMPRESLTARFGPLLLRRVDQALGRIPELIAWEHPPEPVLAEWAFEVPVRGRQAIETTFDRLLHQVIAQLQQRALGTGRLLCQIGTPRGKVEMEIGLARPMTTFEYLWTLLELKLERVPLTEPVSGLRLEAQDLRPVSINQQSLFGADTVGQVSNLPGTQTSRSGRLKTCPTFADEPELAALLDRLSSRLGEEAVLRVELVADHQPERAVRFIPAVRHSGGASIVGGSRVVRGRPAPNAVGRPAPNSHSVSNAQRPLSMQPPTPVVATSIIPESPPISFCWRGIDYVVVRSWGPERIETGWWRHRHVRRDYYRVETTDGCRFWLFRDRQTGKWFLQGSFE